MPLERVLDDIRSNTGEFSRIHLLTKRDLHNIKRDFCLAGSEKYHENDAVSVRIWVELMKKIGGDNPVVFYKDQGEKGIEDFKEEDFCLILMTKFQEKMLKEFGHEKLCVDSTHGTNPSLTTLDDCR